MSCLNTEQSCLNRDQFKIIIKSVLKKKKSKEDLEPNRRLSSVRFRDDANDFDEPAVNIEEDPNLNQEPEPERNLENQIETKEPQVKTNKDKKNSFSNKYTTFLTDLIELKKKLDSEPKLDESSKDINPNIEKKISLKPKKLRKTSSMTQTDPVDILDEENPKWDINLNNYVKLTKFLNMQIKLFKNDDTELFLKALNVNNFINDLITLDILKEAVETHPDHTIRCLELIFKWLSLRFLEINPYFVIKALDYLINLFNLLINRNYKLLDSEIDTFLPYFMEYLRDKREIVLMGVRLIIRELILIYDEKKIFEHLVNGLKINNSELQSQCLEEIGFMIKNYNMKKFCSNESLNKISHMIDSEFEYVSITALNVLSLASVKYGESILKTIDSKYIDIIQNNVEKNSKKISECIEEDEKMLEIYKETFELVKKLDVSINNEIETFGRFENMKNYISSILIEDSTTSIYSLLNISSFLLDRRYLDKFGPFVEDILKNIKESLVKTTIKYYENKEDELNNQLIKANLIVISLLFEKNFCINLNVDLLKRTFESLINTRIILDKDEPRLNDIDTVLINMNQFTDKTNCMISLLRLLNEICSQKKNFNSEKADLVIKLLWVILKGINTGLKNNDIDAKINQVNKDVIRNLSLIDVLNEINYFYESHPKSTWSNIESKLKLKVVNQIIIDIVKTFPEQIYETLDFIETTKNSELRIEIDQYYNKFSKNN